ncbi:alpha-1,4-glucan--maltose-1-phosphate maltosyltransferase [Micrococcales bacterium 31B]|nr:alpha-1,4-glucan--maltose-1-phosphate maltosyltransferase [Micrococcales bacterium 31B]
MGRIGITDVFPTVDGGRWAAKAVAGQAVRFGATVFREGHDQFGAQVVLISESGREHSRVPMTCLNPGLNTWEGFATPDQPGHWTFRIEAYSDVYGTWKHDAEIKVAAGSDVDLMLAEGALVLRRAIAEKSRSTTEKQLLREAVKQLANTKLTPEARLKAATNSMISEHFAEHPLRDLVTPSDTFCLKVERQLALFSAWYEFFPRSEGAYFDGSQFRWVSGTFRTAAERLDAIADMGFDVVYLTPIHPIGRTFRKGRNNTLDGADWDPGSPYAIGSEAGGHDAIHPELGSFDDFDYFVARAREHGLEVALDIALQCSPDHPWVHEHPEWFTVRADGSIAYAENPPKKYQDIYPLNFDRDPEGIYRAINDMLRLWIAHGVTCFRVDNPHTKPLNFWERLLADIGADHPEVIFLSEAFTKPAMMHTLAKIGYHQSYTYYTWRNSAHELREYVEELARDSAHYMRPSFWPTTHDILTPYMTHGGRPAFELRAILAATLVPTWGIYAGYELVESEPRPGAEEQIDNEKYEFKPRDWDAALESGESLAPLLTKLNAVRHAHPSLQRLDNITFHNCENDGLIAFSKHLDAEQSPTGQADTIIVVATTDPHNTRSGVVHLDPEAFGMEWDDRFSVEDLLTGENYTWNAHPYVSFHPGYRVAHILRLRRS